MADTHPRYTLHSLIPAPAHLDLVMVPLSPEAPLETVVALALVRYHDPADTAVASEVVPIILADGLICPVTLGLDDAYMGCYPRALGRDHLADLRAHADAVQQKAATS